jgi:hypothetical protein
MLKQGCRSLAAHSAAIVEVFSMVAAVNEVCFRQRGQLTSLSEADLVTKAARYLKRGLVLNGNRGLVIQSTCSPGTLLSGV